MLNYAFWRTSWGGTPSVIVRKSTFWYDSIHGRTKKIPRKKVGLFWVHCSYSSSTESIVLHVWWQQEKRCWRHFRKETSHNGPKQQRSVHRQRVRRGQKIHQAENFRQCGSLTCEQTSFNQIEKYMQIYMGAKQALKVGVRDFETYLVKCIM